MPVSVEEAKVRLDMIIDKGRVHLYKPIQIAEVLRRARLQNDIDLFDLDSYRNPSLQWRNAVTTRLLRRISTSSARYQHDVWNDTAMPPSILSALNAANRATNGAVERYIYLQFTARQAAITTIMATVDSASPETFQLAEILALFVSTRGIRRSIDKAYEIVTYALFETIVTSLQATVTVRVTQESASLLNEFADLARVLLGIEPGQLEWTLPAHFYRVGVTNAADRGLDMWANFGPAVQVKHITLDERAATEIVDQVESDYIVIVCKDAHAAMLNIVLRQIGWGRRVRGVVKESDLINWYERCLRGKFSAQLAEPLLQRLRQGFKDEFPQVAEVVEFCEERGYFKIDVPDLWQVESDETTNEDDLDLV